MKNFLTIQEAAGLIGVSEETLKNWEKRGKLVPRRNSLGWRLYDPQAIESGRKIILPLNEVTHA